jgi:hypothetical protein
MQTTSDIDTAGRVSAYGRFSTPAPVRDRRKPAPAVPDAGTIAIMAQDRVPSTATVYQLRVVLAGISPLVWRRLLVPAATSIADLHEILQAAFGWSDEHLHRFTIHAVEYGLWRPGSAGFSRDARQVRLGDFGFRRGERFTYEYNFFAGWRHDIRVEEILSRSPRRRYPACSGGARQAPPEHFGSPEEFLALLQRWPPVLIAVRMAEIISDLMDADGDATGRRGDRRAPR